MGMKRACNRMISNIGLKVERFNTNKEIIKGTRKVEWMSGKTKKALR
jgi:hypothetical protein